MNIEATVAEIDAALDGTILWEADTASLADHRAIAWTGIQVQNDGGGWKFLVVEYPDPGGSSAMLAHGSATKLGMVMFLTPGLAAKALKRAKGTRS